MSRRALAALAGALCLAASCGAPGSGRSQADQDKDGRLLAGVLRAADDAGAGFKLDQTLVVTGGQVPNGQEERLHVSVGDGALHAGAARFGYRIQQGSTNNQYDMVVANERLFVKPRASSAWKQTPLPSVSVLFPSLRLELIRETVLLASSVSSGTLTHVESGFARRFVVKPAPDQIEELQSITVSGSAEQQFLRSATAELDVFLLWPGDKLGQVEVHLTGVDPSDGSRQQIDSTLILRSATVKAIDPPGQATQVDPGSILATQ